jgi:hypothetical protein
MLGDKTVGTLQPEQLKLLWMAFDATWDTVKHQYAENELSSDVGRLRTADAVLAGLRSGITDLAGLKRYALAWMLSCAKRDEVTPS